MVELGRFLNLSNHTPPQPVGPEDGGTFRVERQTFDDGIVHCQFTLSNFSAMMPNELQAILPLSQ